MIARYAISFSFAALITFGLFFGMQLLIKMGKFELNTSGDAIRVELGEVREVQEVQRTEEKPAEPEAAEAPPESAIEMSTSVDNATMGIEIGASSMVAEVITSGAGGFSAADGEYLPIVRVAPQYPARAQENGMEGWVLVEFTVTAEGSTADVIVIESSHNMFERNAVKAAERFKFKPRVVDGEPIESLGVRNRIEFKLED